MNRKQAALAFAVVLACGLVRAEEAVPLYTNADLDRMFGKAPESAPAAPYAHATEDWQRVDAFIDREYARMNMQRGYDEDRRDSGEANPYQGTPAWAWYGYYGYGGGSYGRGHHRPKTPTLFTPTPPASGRELRTPLHGSQFRIKSGGFRGYAR